MPTDQIDLAKTRDTGPRSPKSILVAQYSLLVSIGTGIASVTYFTISGPDDTINLIGNTINVATVSSHDSALAGSTHINQSAKLVFSAAYLAVHQFTSWRYSQGYTQSCPYRMDRLRSICLKTCSLVIMAWLTNSVLGVMAASRAPFCEMGAKATREWTSITGCRIQRASVAGSMMAV